MSRCLIFLLCLSLPGLVIAASASEQLQALIDQKEYAEATRQGDQILQQAPNDQRAKFLLAYAYQMQNLEDRAIALYRELIREAPELPEPRNNLAMIYLERGDYDRATELLVAAINTHPSYATAYDNLSRVYKGIASEAYRRALSESSEPASYKHDIELAAIDRLPASTMTSAATATAGIRDDRSPVTAVNLETRMIELVRNWAGAWEGKQFDRYVDAYLPAYRSRFPSHAQWVEHRRKRIMRPGQLSVEVSAFTVRTRSQDRVSVDFTQAFRSPNYRDRVVKRLDFVRSDGTWKIASERVLSVL